MKYPLLGAALLALVSATARCDLVVPGSTAYIEPNPGGATVNGAGVTNWRDSTQHVSWYGEIKNAGGIDCSVSLRLPAGATSRLRFAMTPENQYHDIQVTGGTDGTVTAGFGRFQVMTPGYKRFVLLSLNPPKASAGDIVSLNLSGSAAEDAHFNLLPRRNTASVHLFYHTPPGAKIAAIYCEATSVESPLWTYIMACGWGRGYMGMQVNSPTERRIIFSVWDAGGEKVSRANVAAADRTTLVAKGEGVFTGDFGNEGTGGHSHLVYPWRTGEKQRFLVTSHPVDATHTVYSGYYYHPGKHQWMLIASWNAPLTVGWLDGFYSFSENFGGGNGQLHRKAFYGNQWVMTSAGKWVELNTADFTCDDTGKVSRLDRFGGVENGQFFLSQGGYMPGFMPYGTKLQRPSTGEPPADVVNLVAHESAAAPAAPVSAAQ